MIWCVAVIFHTINNLFFFLNFLSEWLVQNTYSWLNKTGCLLIILKETCTISKALSHTHRRKRGANVTMKKVVWCLDSTYFSPKRHFSSHPRVRNKFICVHGQQWQTAIFKLKNLQKFVYASGKAAKKVIMPEKLECVVSNINGLKKKITKLYIVGQKRQKRSEEFAMYPWILLP